MTRRFLSFTLATGLLALGLGGTESRAGSATLAQLRRRQPALSEGDLTFSNFTYTPHSCRLSAGRPRLSIGDDRARWRLGSASSSPVGSMPWPTRLLTTDQVRGHSRSGRFHQ